MKKNLFYKLILIVLVVQFSLLLNTHTAQAAGVCLTSGNQPVPYNQEECGKLAASFRYHWYSYSNGTQDATGVCLTSGNQPVPYNQEDCGIIPSSFGYRWVPTPNVAPEGQNPPTTTPPTTTPPAADTTDTTTYKLLSPLPCPDPDNNPDCTNNELQIYNIGDDDQLSRYLNTMLTIFIGICAVLAVVMIVLGGIEYMTSELPGNKENGKEKIRNAVFGLLLALGAWLILYTINPDLLKVDLPETVVVTVTLEEQIRGRLGQNPERCVPFTDTNNACHPSKLSAFANPKQASAICNGESSGIANSASGVDKCSDRNPFSFGLFQVNIIAHANTIPNGVCSNIFQTTGGGTQGKCLESKEGVCLKYDCKVNDQEKYRSCVNYITNPINNIAYAAKLNRQSGWTPWGFYASCQVNSEFESL